MGETKYEAQLVRDSFSMADAMIRASTQGDES